MAGIHTLSHQNLSRKSPISKNGVLTIHGFGVRLRVQSGHLEIEDGIGPERRKIRLARVGDGLKRLVCISEDGFITLSALKWLADQQASFIMLDRMGKVLFLTGPTAPSDARLRRAQSLAHQSGAALEIARKLIEAKLIGQEALVRDRLKDSTSADLIAQFREQLPSAENVVDIRNLESHAAGAYWRPWCNVPVSFPKADQPKVPAHWKCFGTRTSPLTGSPRLAVTPPGAILNYCYALLESETRLAMAAVGLDPAIGMLHKDAPNRDSFGCDIMEVARPAVDAWLLNWLMREPLRRSDFFEEGNGNCRLVGAFAAKLSETAPVWGKLIAPWTEWVAQTLWSSIRKPSRQDHILRTPLSQRRRSEGRGKEFFLNVEPPPIPDRICHGCGATTQKGRHCPKCGREISKEKLIELAKLGRVAAQRPESRKRHSETQRRHEAAKRAWRSSPKPAWLTEQTYVEKIQPRLATVTISALSSALGVSEPYAADIRAARHRPHPRHWLTLAQLAGISL